MTGGHGARDLLLGFGPERGAALGSEAVAGEYPIGGYAVLLPRGALGVGVEEDREHAVHGVGVLRLGGGARLEFVPEGAILGGLVGGQEREDTVGGDGLAGVLGGGAGGVVGEGVAGVDLHEVVDEEHLHHAQQIEGGDVGVLGEEYGHNGDVPGVLGVGFLPAADESVVLPANLLEPVDFEEEGDLLGKAAQGKAE